MCEINVNGIACICTPTHISARKHRHAKIHYPRFAPQHACDEFIHKKSLNQDDGGCITTAL